MKKVIILVCTILCTPIHPAIHAQESAENEYRLGYCYYLGIECSEDKKLAAKHMQNAANLGLPRAMYKLGYFYYHGIGVDMDETEAFHYYSKAAECGYDTALVEVAKWYISGIGVKQDTTKGLNILRKMARNKEIAQIALGHYYYSNVYSRQNADSSMKYYMMASKNGSKIASYAIGEIYKWIDADSAKHYFVIAGNQGDSRGFTRADFIDKHRPKITWGNPDTISATKEYNLPIDISSSSSISSIDLYLNGTETPHIKLNKKQKKQNTYLHRSYTYPLILSKGKNIVEIKTQINYHLYIERRHIYYQQHPFDKATLTWLAYEPSSAHQKYRFRAGIKSSSQIDEVAVYVNGEQLRGVSPVSNDGYDMVVDHTVMLNEGSNSIKIRVTNAAGSLTEEKTVVYQPQGLARIEWLAFSPTAKEMQYMVKAGIKSASRILSWKISVNGEEVRGVNPVNNDGYNMTVNKSISLAEGMNSIRIEVTNAAGMAAEEKTVNYIPGKPKPIVQERRIALVIGNAKYNDQPLKNAGNDATDMANKLQELGFTVIRTLDQTKQGMERAINEFGAKARGYDVALFYYAGHGISVDGENFMLPIDAYLPEKSFVRHNCTNVSLPLELMEDANIPMKIVILDACRNNPFTRNWHRGGTTSGLSIMNAPKGTFIAFSTAPGSMAKDGHPNDRNSPYTAALLQTLDIPNLTITDFFQEVLERVAVKTNGAQDPWTSGSFRGKFIFNKQ